MKKLMILGLACALVLGLATNGFASILDEEESDILKKHKEWVAKRTPIESHPLPILDPISTPSDVPDELPGPSDIPDIPREETAPVADIPRELPGSPDVPDIPRELQADFVSIPRDGPQSQVDLEITMDTMEGVDLSFALLSPESIPNEPNLVIDNEVLQRKEIEIVVLNSMVKSEVPVNREIGCRQDMLPAKQADK